MNFTRLDMVKQVIDEITPVYEKLADNFDIYPPPNKKVIDKHLNRAFKRLMIKINIFTVWKETRRRKREYAKFLREEKRAKKEKPDAPAPPEPPPKEPEVLDAPAHQQLTGGENVADSTN